MNAPRSTGTKEPVLSPTSLVMCVVLSLGSVSVVVAVPPATPGAGQAGQTTADDREALERRVQELESLVASLRQEIDRLEAAKGGGGEGVSEALRTLEKRVEALTAEILQLKGSESARPAAEGSINGFGPAASKVYKVKRGVVVGGYGNALYEDFTPHRDNNTPSNAINQADFENATFCFGYRFDDKWLVSSAMTLEHAEVDGGTGSGVASLEFAFVDFKARPDFGARGGLLLLPLGFLNEQHEPANFYGARRPEVERVIIPTTWRELGAGVYGHVREVEYRVYGVTSLDALGFSEAEGVRGGRQSGAQAKAADFGITARVDYSPLPGLILGTSAFTGNTRQGTPGFPEGRFTLWDLHAQYEWRGARFRGLFARSILSDAEAISLALDGTGATAIGERQQGWYVEGGVNVLFGVQKTRQQLIPYCRYEDLNPQFEVAPGFTPDPENDLTVKTCGVSYRPIPQVAITFDAQNFDQQAHTAVDQMNLGLGFSF